MIEAWLDPGVIDPLVIGALVLPPVFAVLAIGVPAVADRPAAEATVNGFAQAVGASGVVAALALCLRVMALGPAEVDLGRWYGDAEYALELWAAVDARSAGASLLIAVVGWMSLRFSAAYLHREPGHARFFATCLLALACLQVIALAGTLDMLFVGWELLGLCSFLLIAFFHEREETVARGLRALFNYRFADLGLLFGLILLHSEHLPTQIGPEAAPSPLGLILGPLLLLTAAGKSGMAPFTGWLARSAEGPTSSTALFYAGLSVHAGPWLLLRAWPLYADAMGARVALVVVGGVTALASSLSARTRSDVKGAVLLAGGAQVGLIAVEIGLGLHTLAALHMVGNIGLRTWQLLRAPSVLHLAHERERQLGGPVALARPIPWALWLLGTAGGVEPIVNGLVAALGAIARSLDALSRRIEALALGGGR